MTVNITRGLGVMILSTMVTVIVIETFGPPPTGAGHWPQDGGGLVRGAMSAAR